MKKHRDIYRKTFSLIIALLILISLTFVVALVISYNLTAKYVENEFASKKIDVLDQTTKPYYDFFQNRIPEITSYQGFLDSAFAANYADSVFHDFSFVKDIIFYDMRIGNRNSSAFIKNNLGITIKAVYEYKYNNGVVAGARKSTTTDETDFNKMAIKLSYYIAYSDTSRTSTQDEIFKTFYDIDHNKISYSNILRHEDVKILREWEKQGNSSSSSKQNIMTFFLDPKSLPIKNPHPELYQNITIQPVVYDPLGNGTEKLVTQASLPGAFSEFELYFSSDQNYLNAEVNRRFLPIGSVVLLIYCLLLLTGWLIYRNLNVNVKLFKLQYDFINNFTHEFKTPVSVIKIAGSNLSGDNELSERQRKQYGKILNEEADKLNELMSKLLSFTQIENKSIKINKQETNLESFVSRYVQTFLLKYPDFKIEYKIFNITTFNIDPLLLGSIFQNLMENAYKYAHPTKKALRINIVHEKKHVVFSFTDTGIGINKSELSNIFKKFYRVENQYNQNGSVGLGLAFCKEIVNFMHGEISVNSKVNEGSEFIVTLPYEN
jgi:two-component system phosphate regulon sensor histidine kinase PhoR